ncbi:MAG: histidine kinase [Thermodesulfobacteriota bacterium]|nr:histidine kinase [Thermodesulfobacteriota bacterium]
MDPKFAVINRRHVLKTFSYTALFNTGIAIFLRFLEFGGGFMETFIITQCIGMSICACILLVHFLIKSANFFIQMAAIFIAMIIGSVLGTLLGTVASGIGTSIFFQKYSLLQMTILGIVFGSIISYFIASRETISASKTLIQEERIKRLIGEKKVVESNLRFLQAQIEPHFLFNTLSNIVSLLETDLEKGKYMLEDLIHYLRTSLSKTRSDTTTIGQEMDMIRAYINIFKVRMGNRLQYQVDVPESIKDIPFPPMLIQPLVENAIKHGLEPKIEGGEVFIGGDKNEEILRLEIADTGVGFYEKNESGTGLSNIRERLQSIYGDKGRLILEDNRPCGLKAIIEVPHARDKSDHR